MEEDLCEDHDLDEKTTRKNFFLLLNVRGLRRLAE
jgi:hypothetical protein